MPPAPARCSILLGIWFASSMLQVHVAARAEGPATAGIESALAAHALPGARVGIVVRRLSDGKEIFSRRGTEPFEMASNTKLFTTAAALWQLGPDYEFRTAVIANGPIEASTLTGDLVIVGGGDPNLSGRFHGGDVTAVPREIATAVGRAGIREVTGDLVMDDRLFDRAYRHPDWPTDELMWWYAAPVSALSFNDNCVDVKVTGGASPGRPAIVTYVPNLPVVAIANRCETCRRRKREGITFSRGADGVLEVGGRIRGGVTRTESIAVENPPLFLAAAIREAMAGMGIRVRGKDRVVASGERALPEAREIFAWRSKLSDAVVVANRRSQNFYAEQILKTLGAARSGVGSFASGTAAVGDFLASAGFPAGTVAPADGSGLSPGNRATPQAICALLEIMYRGKLRDVFYHSLAVNGDPETTLRRRLTEPAALGRIHAKTGTIKSRGVSALSGYAEALDGEVYAFSILTNDFRPALLGKVRAMDDAICRALIGVPQK